MITEENQYSQEIFDAFEIVKQAAVEKLRLHAKCVQPTELVELGSCLSEKIYIAAEDDGWHSISNPQIVTLQKIDGRGVIKTSLGNFSTKWHGQVLSTQKNDRHQYWKLYDLDVLVDCIKDETAFNLREKLRDEKHTLERAISGLDPEKDTQLIQSLTKILASPSWKQSLIQWAIALDETPTLKAVESRPVLMDG